MTAEMTQNTEKGYESVEENMKGYIKKLMSIKELNI